MTAGVAEPAAVAFIAATASTALATAVIVIIVARGA